MNGEVKTARTTDNNANIVPNDRSEQGGHAKAREGNARNPNTEAECDTWLAAPVEQALKLQRPPQTVPPVLLGLRDDFAALYALEFMVAPVRSS